MNMFAAIAQSAGSKARAYSDNGRIIVVQERYSGVETWWFHLWEITHQDGVGETDIPYRQTTKIQPIYRVDPNADYWHPV